jgi:hypothetical protein
LLVEAPLSSTKSFPRQFYINYGPYLWLIAVIFISFGASAIFFIMSRKAGPPQTHTVVIFDPRTMWEKLAWDIWTFDELQRMQPDRQRLAYSAINVCIAASSLQGWTLTYFKKNRLGEDRQFHKLLSAHVPHQAPCLAIANTSKHAGTDPSKWPGGSVHLQWYEPDEDDPGGWRLYHTENGGYSSTMALSRFTELRNQWWSFLVEIGAAEGRQPVPEWQQIELRRIFGQNQTYASE